MKLVDYLFQIAIRDIENIPAGREFLVRDIFGEKNWALIPSKNRMELGKMLNSYYANKATNVVVESGKVDDVQEYRRL